MAEMALGMVWGFMLGATVAVICLKKDKDSRGGQRMNNDLISREALKEHKHPIPLIGDYQQGWNDAIDVIYDNAPTVPNEYMRGYEAAEREYKRPTGEWYFSCEKGWECNKCHEVIKEMPTCMRKPLFNFCPNCGAYMRKETEND